MSPSIKKNKILPDSVRRSTRSEGVWYGAIFNNEESSQHTARFRAGAISSPASTGNDNNNNIAVINIAHTNNGNLCKLIPLVLILSTVVIKLIAPNKEETPAKCKLKIAKSTLPPEWLCTPANGG